MKAAKSAPKASKPRVRALPTHRSFRLTKKKLKQYKPVPGPWPLLKESFGLIRSNKKTFIGITVAYGLISFMFIQGFGVTFDLIQAKKSLEEVLGNSSSKISNGVALFSYLAGNSTSSVEGSTAYQVMFGVIISLAVIWAARQAMAGEKPGFRDPFYKGMYPLTPFVAVLVVISIQFIPFALGSLMYSTVLNNGLAVTILEKVLWLLLFGLFVLVTLYLVISSIFALYIVTLPDVRPLSALKSARELVLHRRFAIGVRMLALPIVLIIASFILFVPLIIFATPIAEPLFLCATSFLVVYFHVYMYTLYRHLI